MSFMTPKIYADPETLGRVFAGRLLDEIAQARAAGRSFLLGCPGGRSPKPVYQAMGGMLTETPQDMSHVSIVMMDDYLVETSSGLDHVPIESHFSCRRFARDDRWHLGDERVAHGRRNEPNARRFDQWRFREIRHRDHRSATFPRQARRRHDVLRGAR